MIVKYLLFIILVQSGVVLLSCWAAEIHKCAHGDCLRSELTTSFHKCDYFTEFYWHSNDEVSRVSFTMIPCTVNEVRGCALACLYNWPTTTWSDRASWAWSLGLGYWKWSRVDVNTDECVQPPASTPIALYWSNRCDRNTHPHHQGAQTTRFGKGQHVAGMLWVSHALGLAEVLTIVI